MSKRAAKEVGDFLQTEQAKRIKTFLNDDLKGTVKKSIEIGSPNERNVAETGKHGIDISGYSRHLDNSSVNHIRKNHGANSEANRGQIHVTDDHLSLIPFITDNSDSMTISKGKTGLDVLHYEKRINWKVAYYEEVRPGKKQLVPLTFYIK